MKNEIKLYNIILPPYLLLVFVPWLATLCIIGNFIIDSLVLLIISISIYKKINGSFYKKNIWKIWLLGFVGDFVGILFLFIGSQVGYSYIHSNDNHNSLEYLIMTGLNNISNHPNEVNIYSYIYIIMSIVASSIVILILDYFIAFRKADLTKKQRFLSSLAFAVITAPYTFLLPNSLFY